MRIGELADRAGVSVRSLRYYEEQGLVEADRTPSGQRSYPKTAVARVLLIQQFYAAGVPSRSIARILPHVDSGVTTPEILEILIAQREKIRDTIANLEDAGARLDAVIDHAGHGASDPSASGCSYSHDQVA